MDVLRAANGHVNPRRLQVGQTITVPVDGASVNASVKAAEPARWASYRVRPGDSLWGIARRHSVSVSELRRVNGIGNRIYPGQRLRIPA